jgi:inorganic pyrophosphatase
MNNEGGGFMPIKDFPKDAKKFQLQVYKRPSDWENLHRSHVAFGGSPQKHPYDPDKIILVTDPYSSSTAYFEFRTDDISYVEEMNSIVNMEGQTVTMARIWVRKRSVAIRCSPFVVEDTREL